MHNSHCVEFTHMLCIHYIYKEYNLILFSTFPHSFFQNLAMVANSSR